MEFDNEGRIILPDSVKQDLENDARSIIITRIQIRQNNPAIAQLKIEIGKNLGDKNPNLMGEIQNFCRNFSKYEFSKVEPEIKIFGNSLIVEVKSHYLMYAFFERLLEALVDGYKRNRGFEISLRGSFGSFN